MKKFFNTFILASALTLFGCSSGKKEKEQQAADKASQEAVTRLKNAEAVARQKAATQKAEADAARPRDQLGQEAAWYLRALGDSLVSTEVMGNGKYDFGAGFPAAIRAVEKRYSSAAFKVVAGISVDYKDEDIKANTEVLVIDSLGRQSKFVNGAKQ